MIHRPEERRAPASGADTLRLRLVALLAAGLLLFGLEGCGGPGDQASPVTSLTVEEPYDAKYFPSDEPYKMGAEQFNRGHYGLAERYFRDAVEKAPGDAGAWIALASSCDRLRRFDLADRAYQKALAITGETAQILNNQGYSFMLRGNLRAARAKFLKASEREPDNQTILNNIKLLDGSAPYIQSRN